MSKKIYVGNLPYSANDQTLADAFAECGNVDSAKVITDRETGRSKGFAFVEMSTVEEAAEAIKRFNGAELDGRAVSVMEAKPQAPRTGGGGGSRGGYNNSRRSY
ncbi:RNA recognition motif domain-containing protein [Bdellovibrio sp. GT3]|uniref:RNA recognition motif domain-containing protein n=1 Tax=Bdellovibrio sp. GT3 TaxID=3136282 RepID=UPI0030F1F501